MRTTAVTAEKKVTKPAPTGTQKKVTNADTAAKAAAAKAKKAASDKKKKDEAAVKEAAAKARKAASEKKKKDEEREKAERALVRAKKSLDKKLAIRKELIEKITKMGAAAEKIKRDSNKSVKDFARLNTELKEKIASISKNLDRNAKKLGLIDIEIAKSKAKVESLKAKAGIRKKRSPVATEAKKGGRIFNDVRARITAFKEVGWATKNEKLINDFFNSMELAKIISQYKIDIPRDIVESIQINNTEMKLQEKIDKITDKNVLDYIFMHYRTYGIFMGINLVYEDTTDFDENMKSLLLEILYARARARNQKLQDDMKVGFKQSLVNFITNIKGNMHIARDKLINQITIIADKQLIGNNYSAFEANTRGLQGTVVEEIKRKRDLEIRNKKNVTVGELKAMNNVTVEQLKEILKCALQNPNKVDNCAVHGTASGPVSA